MRNMALTPIRQSERPRSRETHSLLEGLRNSKTRSLVLIVLCIVGTAVSGCVANVNSSRPAKSSSTIREWSDKWPNGAVHWKGQVLEKDGVQVRIGNWYSWFEDGMPETACRYSDGLLDGPYREWWESGKLCSEGQYSKGAKAGEWRKWSSQGNLLDIEQWREGLREGPFTYYRLGDTIVGSYVGDRLHGRWTTYDLHHRIRIEGNYENGERKGRWREWDASGKLISEREY